ncbi:MAG: hypothetical protein JW928_04640, partial [Candidatus Aureabacteria bacterium]|nr:hypothetical protein [Candidatus Auribacterota bacterium]
MKRRKTIEDLYREVKDFDLVLTHDAALADALNRRLNSPRIGPFAETVKNYVLKKTRYTHKDELLDEQKIVSSLAGQTGSYQKARYFLSLLEDCWNKMEGIDPSYFPVPEFMQIPENVFRFFKTRRTYWLEAGRIVFSQKARIAVIEKELLSPFEGSVLPSFAENISLFSEEKADFPGFCVFDTNHDLIQAVARSIHVENQQNFGIVVDEGSLYSSTIKGALLAKGVNIIGQKDVMDDIPFRQTLSVLRMSLDAEALLIRDVAGFLGLMGARMLTENYSYFLKDYPENEPGFEKVTKLYQDIRQIKDMTFQEFIRTYPLYAGHYLESIVRNYSFENKMIVESLSELEYLLFLFGHELGKNVKGVVLADARSSL